MRVKDVTVQNSAVMFFSLFNHIQRKNVAMTAPVVMTYQAEILEHADTKGDVSMEFLYRTPDQGKAGPGVGAVKVEDFPAGTFVCLGVQGEMKEKVLRRVSPPCTRGSTNTTTNGSPRDRRADLATTGR